MNAPYFPQYVNEFLADTSGLSNEEVGAYQRILCQAWKQEIVGTLPDDDATLARFACMDRAKWQEMKPIILFAFRLGQDGRWHHSGLRAAFEQMRRFSKSRQENAKRRWEVNGSTSKASAKQVHSTSNANGKQKSSLSPAPATTTAKEELPNGRAKAPPDERSKHRAIQAVKRLAGRYPNKLAYDKIISVLGEDFDEGRLEDCAAQWATKTGNMLNLDWIFDWYVNGIPDVKVKSKAAHDPFRDAR